MPVKAVKKKTPNFTATASHWPSLMRCTFGHVAKTSQALPRKPGSSPLQLDHITVAVVKASSGIRNTVKTYTHMQPYMTRHRFSDISENPDIRGTHGDAAGDSCISGIVRFASHPRSSIQLNRSASSSHNTSLESWIQDTADIITRQKKTNCHNSNKNAITTSIQRTRIKDT